MKVVPNTPHTPLRKTIYTSFGCCNGDHPPLFSVREDIKLSVLDGMEAKAASN